MRADRLISLMLLLQSRGRMTAQGLASILEVSERTIYRDVDALSAAGIPVFTQAGLNGGIFLDESYRISLTGLSKEEVQALFISSGAGPLKDLGLERAAADTMLKLLATLSSRQRDEAQRMRQRVYIDPSGWFQSGEPLHFLPQLQQAVWEDRRVRFTYQRPDGTLISRTVDALGLVAKANLWYLVGRQAVGELRTFRVSRFQELELSETLFERSEDFDLAAYWEEWSRSFEEQLSEGQEECLVVVRVHPRIVRLFIAELSGRYERLDVPDVEGWIVLRLNFPSLDSARMHILATGSQVEVLEPGDLRDEIRRTARQILAMYRKADLRAG